MRLKTKFVNRITSVETVKKLTFLTAAVLVLSTVFSLFGRYRYFELFTHFRLQYAWLALICVVISGVFRFWKISLLVAVCALFNVWQIAPYYYPSSVAAPRQENNRSEINLRLMSANVQGNNKNYQGLIEAVESVNPDVLVLLEVTENWRANIQVLDSEYRYSKIEPRAGGSGLAVFSRYRIESADVLTLDASTQPALFCKINLESTLLSVLIMHPPTPMRADKFSYRNGQFSQAASIMKNASEPKLLVGDFNTTMWSPYFADLVKDSGLRDARTGRGLYPSWNAALPAFFGIPIDHCLVGDKIEVESFETGNYTGSDHRPLILNVRIEE
jgi:endonuclease/exonuclease/phosphatase (EEP) superfamily protein YafD